MKRIFMLSNHPVFGEGVEILLRQQADLKFVGRESNPELAIECIKQLHPDVVIVDTGLPGGAAATIVQILGACPEIRVIGLDLSENTLCIYHGEQKIVHGVDDLRIAIGSGVNSAAAMIPEKGKGD